MRWVSLSLRLQDATVFLELGCFQYFDDYLACPGSFFGRRFEFTLDAGVALILNLHIVASVERPF